MLKIKNKKAKIAETLSWGVAFVIIIPFVIGLVVFSSFYEGGNEISFYENFYSGELLDILNSQIEINGEFMNVIKLIVLWDSDKNKYQKILEEEVKKVLNDFEYEYMNSKTDTLHIVAFGIVVHPSEGLGLPIESNHFYDDYCVDTKCEDVDRIYLDKVYVGLQVSQGEKKK